MPEVMRKTGADHKVIRKDLVYPELSYAIIGSLMEVSNNLGSGYREQYYQRALAAEFKRVKVSFREQVPCDLVYKGEKIGRGYIDFLVDDKIAIEIKKDGAFSKKNIDQLYSYLKIKDLKLGILANFTRVGVRFKRILNIQ